MIVDDHSMLRKGLIELLNKNAGYEVVGEAANGRDALKTAESVKPDVILLDVSMPELNGIDAITHLKKIRPEAKIIIISMYDSERHIKGALRNGATGYLHKGADASELFLAIDRVHKGKYYLSDRINDKFLYNVISSDFKSISDDQSDILTTREKEILHLVVEGCCGKEISDRLNISLKTVEHHRSNILSKMNCVNAAQLVYKSFREGFLDVY